MSRTMATVLATVLAFSGLPAAASVIDLSSLTNANLQNYTGGSDYPLAGSSVNVNGVVFTMSSVGGNANSTGAIQLSGGQSSTINVGQTGVNAVYVLLNSTWGSIGSLVGTLTFNSGSNSYNVNLTEGTNVRDHFEGGYNNVATDIYGTLSYSSGARLDAYRYVLPTVFNGQIDNILFSSSTNSGNPDGAPFVAAVTTVPAAVPEPASWMTLITGFGLLGVVTRRRSNGEGRALA